MENLVYQDGELYLYRSFYQQASADDIFASLSKNIEWQEEAILIFGKYIKVPRLMAWYGDPEAVYKYSGVTHEPLPWTDELKTIKQRIECFSGQQFNSVLANLYRNGNDSMGCHADNEKELGKNPFIASLNFGEQRLFRIRHNKSKKALDLELAHGDLLLMGGVLQHHWRHSVPKTRKAKKPRINLTFRKILGL